MNILLFWILSISSILLFTIYLSEMTYELIVHKKSDKIANVNYWITFWGIAIILSIIWLGFIYNQNLILEGIIWNIVTK